MLVGSWVKVGEILVYYTPILSAQQYSCQECPRLTETFFSFNEMKIVSTNWQDYCAKIPMYMQIFLNVVKMVN